MPSARKTQDKIKEPKMPKKRGRKPKEKIYGVVRQIDMFFDQPFASENIILHLPLKSLPNDANPNDPEENTSETESSKTWISFAESDDELSEIIGNQKSTLSVEEYIPKHAQFASLKANPSKIKSILVEFLDFNNKEGWLTSTNTACWWCCHKFETPPCSIPDKYIDETFYVYGCFCSFNCSLSYLFDTCSYRLWEKVSLLKLLCRQIMDSNIPLVRAPPRESLKLFGGYMEIIEFRSNFLQIKKNFRILLPPIISINLQVEEQYVPLEDNDPIIVHNRKISRQLRIKRNKPLKRDKSSLEATMGLIIN